MTRPRKKSDFRAAMLFLLPNFLGFALFTAGPVIISLAASFTNWTLSGKQVVWTGSENFIELIHDNEFWLYLVNTIYLMLGLPFAIFGSLLLAMLLSKKLRGMTIYRTMFYLPTFTSGVALMILWKALYNPDFGPINSILRGMFHFLHLSIEPPTWLLSTHSLLALAVEHAGFDAKQLGVGARDALIIMGVWIAIGGNNMLLYLAALTNVPQELYEAASIDGAGKWTSFWNVTWPQLAPTTFFITILSFIGGLTGGFEQARVMTLGGPAGTTITLSYYIYIKAFEQLQMGYASAVSWALFSVIFVLTLVGWRFGNRAMGDL